MIEHKLSPNTQLSQRFIPFQACRLHIEIWLALLKRSINQRLQHTFDHLEILSLEVVGGFVDYVLDIRLSELLGRFGNIRERLATD